MSSEPFEIAIDDHAIDKLRHRLSQTRWAPESGNFDGRYGVQQGYLRDLVEYWLDEFDWRRQEAQMNSHDHFRTEIDHVPIHYMVARGRGPHPIPLILSHGWPSSFWDFHEIVGPLTDPAAHGGDERDAFDVIIPSLPGFTFSTPLEVTGVTPARIARMWRDLMGRLGYRRFGCAGGDWGSAISVEMGAQFADDVIGVYLSSSPRFLVDEQKLTEDDYGPGEEDWRDGGARRRLNSVHHTSVQTHGPQTLSWGLNDSPVGLASWLLERWQRWSDSHGDVESVFTRDFLLTTISLYWFTQSIGSSMRIYADTFAGDSPMRATHFERRVEVPTGIVVFPRELSLFPRSACERVTNLVHWTVLPRGGHFGAAEQPALYVEDIRAFFRPLR